MRIGQMVLIKVLGDQVIPYVSPEELRQRPNGHNKVGQIAGRVLGNPEAYHVSFGFNEMAAYNRDELELVN